MTGTQEIVRAIHCIFPNNVRKQMVVLLLLGVWVKYHYFEETTITLDAEFNESDHPRDKNGRFTNGTSLEELKSTIKEGLMNPESEMPKIEATKENFRRLAPHSEVNTPLGVVKFGEHQFEKLVSHNRENLLGAMFDVLSRPKLITQEKDEQGRNALVYIKSYKGKNTKPDCIVSVVVDIENQKVSVSTHQRKFNQILNRITAPEQVIFNSFG